MLTKLYEIYRKYIHSLIPCKLFPFPFFDDSKAIFSSPFQANGIKIGPQHSPANPNLPAGQQGGSSGGGCC
jgi:hypothetical protein